MPMKRSSFDDYLAAQPKAQFDAQQAEAWQLGGMYDDPNVGLTRDQLIAKSLGGLTRQQYFDQKLKGPGREYNAATNTLGMMDNNNFELSPAMVAAAMFGLAGPAIAAAGAGGLEGGSGLVDGLGTAAYEGAPSISQAAELAPSWTPSPGTDGFLASQDAEQLATGNAMLQNSGMNYEQYLRSLSQPNLLRTPSTPPTAPKGEGAPTDTPKTTGPQSITDQLKKYALQAGVNAGITSLVSPSTKYTDTTGTLRDLAASDDARIRASAQAVLDQFGGYDDNYYTGIADAYKNYARPLVDEQATEARRVMPFAFSDSGGSAYQTKAGQLERDVNRGYADVGNEALQQSDARRSNVENTKSGLIDLVQSGADTDIVAQEAAAKAKQFTAPPPFSPISDLFGKYTADAANYSIARAIGSQQGGGAFSGGAPLLFGPRRTSQVNVA